MSHITVKCKWILAVFIVSLKSLFILGKFEREINIILKILFSTGINIDYFIFKSERCIQIILWQFCISYINFAIWVNTLSLPCAIIYSENYWQNVWTQERLVEVNISYTLHFLFNQNIFESLKYNWTGRSGLPDFGYFPCLTHSLIHLFFFIICSLIFYGNLNLYKVRESTIPT